VGIIVVPIALAGFGSTKKIRTPKASIAKVFLISPTLQGRVLIPIKTRSLILTNLIPH